jgi:saccharopine dehydrogenase-like NADP-dependent oxidoreductase
MQVLVLGGGLVGSAIARNLSRDESLTITVADYSPKVCQSLKEQFGLSTTQLNVSDTKALTGAVRNSDLVIGAVPGSLGFAMLQTVIRAKKDIVDISFFPEDPLTLHQLAVDHGVTAVVDAGVAPGLSNLVLGRYQREYDPLDYFACYVGGLPKLRKWPFEYQSVFSPADVIEIYTRPVRMKIGGQLVTREALTERELIDLPRIGTLEAANTDGLRTLLSTVQVPNMLEKTLRYPGHFERMQLLRDTGFFSSESLDIEGHPVAPLDVTSELLFQTWQPEENGYDLTVMRIILSGLLDGRHITTTMDMFDEYDQVTDTTSMARTTGYTCAAVARLLMAVTYRNPGIRPLEYLGEDKEVYRLLLKDLAEWGIAFNITQTAAED